MRINSEATKISQVLSLLPKKIISLTVFKWTLPLSLVLAVVSTPASISDGSEIAIWLLIGALGHMSMLPFVIYGRDKSSSEQIMLVLLMGFTRGGVIAVLAPLFDVTDSLPAAQRVVNSMVAVFYWSQAGAVIVEYGIEFRQRLRALLNEVLEKNIVGLPVAAKRSQNSVMEVIGHLQEKIIATVGSTPSKEQLQNASREIDALINNYIKPLSQSRWKDGEIVWVKAGFLAVLKRTLSLNPLPIVAVIALTLPFTLIAQISRIGLIQTIQVQIIWTLIVLGITLFVYRKKPIDGNFLKLNCKFLLLLPLAYVATFFVQIISPLPQESSLINMLRGYLLSAVTQVIAYLIGSLLLSLHKDQEFVFEFISELIRAGELESLLSKTMSGNLDVNYAQYLHAEVQSQLLACKLLLLKAAESEFEIFSPEVTKQITDRMEKIKQPYEKAAARVPAERLVELKNSWAGLAKISHHLPPELSQLHGYSDITSQLIEESVVNSIRHGKASEIEVTAAFEGSLLIVTVSDNGEFISDQGHSGLGTILFNTFTTNWRLARQGDSTVLSFTIETMGRA